MPRKPSVDETWRAILTGRILGLGGFYHLLGLMPSEHRCKNCKAPFDGIGAPLMRLLGRAPYLRNPRFCNF